MRRLLVVSRSCSCALAAAAPAAAAVSLKPCTDTPDGPGALCGSITRAARPHEPGARQDHGRLRAVPPARSHPAADRHDRVRRGRPRLLDHLRPRAAAVVARAAARPARPAARRPARRRPLVADQLPAAAELPRRLHQGRRRLRPPAGRARRTCTAPARPPTTSPTCSTRSASRRSTSTATRTARSWPRRSRSGTPTACARSCSTPRTPSRASTRCTRSTARRSGGR